jgi:hypothetical protein
MSGGAYAVGLLPPIRTEEALRRGFPRTANQACRSNVGWPKSVVRGEAVIRACCLLAALDPKCLAIPLRVIRSDV